MKLWIMNARMTNKILRHPDTEWNEVEGSRFLYFCHPDHFALVIPSFFAPVIPSETRNLLW
jgi:hypothetical protein